ncbi:hypothetical protein TNCV_948441 [Trichonephila clavipes]|nr:hypothetical protein TNCV_948441 [Trichonephila clavipes]
MALSCSLPQINLDVQGETQGVSTYEPPLTGCCHIPSERDCQDLGSFVGVENLVNLVECNFLRLEYPIGDSAWRTEVCSAQEFAGNSAHYYSDARPFRQTFSLPSSTP